MKSLTEEIERYVKTNKPLIERRLEVLKQKKTIPHDIEIEDLEDLKSLPEDLQSKISKEITELRNKREELGYNGPYLGYHTSPAKLKIGKKINPGTDGKAYFSDEKSLFSKNNTIRHVYMVSSDCKIPDEREPNYADGRWYSRAPLVILRGWTKDEFLNEHPEAEFR